MLNHVSLDQRISAYYLTSRASKHKKINFHTPSYKNLYHPGQMTRVLPQIIKVSPKKIFKLNQENPS